MLLMRRNSEYASPAVDHASRVLLAGEAHSNGRSSYQDAGCRCEDAMRSRWPKDPQEVALRSVETAAEDTSLRLTNYLLYARHRTQQCE
jgi:hypothetical protein